MIRRWGLITVVWLAGFPLLASTAMAQERVMHLREGYQVADSVRPLLARPEPLPSLRVELPDPTGGKAGVMSAAYAPSLAPRRLRCRRNILIGAASGIVAVHLPGLVYPFGFNFPGWKGIAGGAAIGGAIGWAVTSRPCRIG